MEDILRKLNIQPPPPGLRAKVLAAARAELEQGANKRDWVDRVWESRGFWYSAAATVLLCLVAIFITPTDRQPRQVAMTPPTPATVALAKDLAQTLGDGPALELRLLAQLSKTEVPSGHDTLSQTELLRSIQ